MALVDIDLANLSLDEENDEDEGLQFAAEEGPQQSIYDLCLAGCALTANEVNFLAMKNKMANLWHPLGGIQISELGEKMYLFRFFYEVDLEQVISGTPWTFNNHLFILYKLKNGEDPSSVPLVFSDFWVQIHNLPPGFFTDNVEKLLGNFIGKFLEHDTEQLNQGFRNYMRIRVQIDIRNPLKRKKKILIPHSDLVLVKFRYEKLSLFCFLCGCLGHVDKFCQKRIDIRLREVELDGILHLGLNLGGRVLIEAPGYGKII
ncbi:hypothetical protein PVK06_023825 [Gossypium arboreum]|uniref:Uncharacterized protein n=1 Tax=Gossypium arboreum TaxID=29729 RepID=A0ABR0PCJ0_GOSAR|nr:hypothetical protein PVK06_023825 [Gossypium arboreum]